jgi:hypothetical protein
MDGAETTSDAPLPPPNDSVVMRTRGESTAVEVVLGADQHDAHCAETAADGGVRAVIAQCLAERQRST